MWWILVPVGLVVGKKLYDVLTEEEPISILANKSHICLELRGEFNDKSVLVIGRTGAGKSSLINMIRGKPVLNVGDIDSTTRWIEGVLCQVGAQTMTLVDSPGIGEISTHTDYKSGIENWFTDNRTSIKCIILVVQADSKGHSDDKKLLDSLVNIAQKPVIIAINQVDKIRPVRQVFTSCDWYTESNLGSAKSQRITEKIDEVFRQFGRSYQQIHILPIVSEPGYLFNRNELIQILQTCI